MSPEPSASHGGHVSPAGFPVAKHVFCKTGEAVRCTLSLSIAFLVIVGTGSVEAMGPLAPIKRRCQPIVPGEKTSPPLGPPLRKIDIVACCSFTPSHCRRGSGSLHAGFPLRSFDHARTS